MTCQQMSKGDGLLRGGSVRGAADDRPADAVGPGGWRSVSVGDTAGSGFLAGRIVPADDLIQFAGLLGWHCNTTGRRGEYANQSIHQNRHSAKPELRFVEAKVHTAIFIPCAQMWKRNGLP